MSWLGDWKKRRPIDIDHSVIDAQLSGFAALIHLSASAGKNSDDVTGVFDELESDANRKKIAVTLADGLTQCYVEIEEWDHANEKAWLWVKVPTVSADTDTRLYLYYDKNQADNTTYVGDKASTPGQSVWDGDFNAVWHMDADGGTTIEDSTSNNIDGTKTASGEPAEIDGKIGKAQSFDGSNDKVDIGDDRFESDEQGTIELLVYFPNATDDYTAFSTSRSPGTADMLRIRITSDYNLAIQHMISGGLNLVGTTSHPGTGWHYLVLTSSGTAWELWIDGVKQSLTVIDGSNTGDWFADLTAAITHLGRIGGLEYGGSYYSEDCYIDEVRISKVKRSDAWIKATFYSGDDNLVTFMAEEQRALPAVYIIGAVNLEKAEVPYHLYLTGDLAALFERDAYLKGLIDLWYGWYSYGKFLPGDVSMAWKNQPYLISQSDLVYEQSKYLNGLVTVIPFYTKPSIGAWFMRLSSVMKQVS